ncbi:MAG: CopG family transcriptional regulator [Chloroflexi bacterium]|nr:CopG family transcriptional regulator [Chloroflexota bacterium]
MSTVTSVRLNEDLLTRLDKLAAMMDRSRTWVIEQAVARYVEEEAPQVAAIREALDDYLSGNATLIPHDEVMRRLEEKIQARVDSESRLARSG